MGDRTYVDEERPDQAGRGIQDRAASGCGAPPSGISPVSSTQLAGSRRRLVVLGAVLLAIIFGVAGLLIAARRSADLAESEQAMTNLAQVLAEQTSRTIHSVDLTLREIVDRLPIDEARPDSVTRWISRTTFDLLVDRRNGLPQADAFILVGADGHLLNSSRGFPAVSLDVSDRDFYRHFSTLDDRGVFISVPVKSYTTGKWTVCLSRRVNDAHGAFTGIVLAAVTLS
jgi:hypothetical protein